MTAVIVVGLTMFAPPLMGAQESGPSDLGDADSKITGAAANDTAGWSVASAGDVDGDGVDDLIVGVPGYDGAAGEDSGAAFLFFGPVDRDNIELSEADVAMGGVDNGDEAGWSVASAGDLNDDGVDDVIVGAPLNDRNGDRSGAAYVVHGGSWLPESMSLADANATLLGGADDRAGWSVGNTSALPGDEQGVIVGALGDSTGADEAGAAFLVGAQTLAEGASLNLDDDADATLVGEGMGDHAGAAVSSAGDVDGDGVDDVLVGAPRNDSGGTQAGAAYVVLGSVGGQMDLGDADVELVGEAEGDRAGFAVSAGDLDDDGMADVVVGAPNNDAAGNDSGIAYVVFGSESLPDEVDLADADASLEGEAAEDRAGWSVDVATAGAGTCDGVDDLLVGAPQNDGAASNAGAAYLVFGDASLSGSTSLADADQTFVGEAANDAAGMSVAFAGDVNDDGTGDVAIGAPREDTTAQNAGAVYVVHRDCPDADDGRGYGYGYGYGYS